MKIYAILAITLAALSFSQASAEPVPSWIKDNAGWWAQGEISDDIFIQGIQYLIAEQIIDIPAVQAADQQSQEVPGWVKNVAGWWATDVINDEDFLASIQHLVKIGIITIHDDIDAAPQDETLHALQAELEECQEIKKVYQRLNCEDAAEDAITVFKYKRDTQPVQVGPINYYWKGLGSDGNSLETSKTGQAMLSIRMLAENAGSERIALNCTSPQICSYDVTDGSAAFKYSGMDFTNGQIVLNPGDSREFNMLFGPNIGYGGTQFVYDPTLNYHFRISEDFGSVEIPLHLK